MLGHLALGFVLASFLFGCGEAEELGGVDLRGLYRVTYHTLSDTSCEVEGLAVAEPPNLRIYLWPWPPTAFAMHPCTNDARESCGPTNDGTDIGFFVDEPIGDGWQGIADRAMSSEAMSCEIGRIETTAVLVDDT